MLPLVNYDISDSSDDEDVRMEIGIGRKRPIGTITKPTAAEHYNKKLRTASSCIAATHVPTTHSQSNIKLPSVPLDVMNMFKDSSDEGMHCLKVDYCVTFSLKLFPIFNYEINCYF